MVNHLVSWWVEEAVVVVMVVVVVVVMAWLQLVQVRVEEE